MGNGTPVHATSIASSSLDFDSVYEHEFDFVYRVVARLASTADVEDLVQEVFIVVHRKLPEFRGDARITTWLFRIAYRVVGAYVRRERLRRTLLFWIGADADEYESSSSPSERHLDDARAVRAGLERLSFEKRSALLLFEVEGWSGEEIAKMLGVPIGTVYTRLLHARREFVRAHDRFTERGSR